MSIRKTISRGLNHKDNLFSTWPFNFSNIWQFCLLFRANRTETAEMEEREERRRKEDSRVQTEACFQGRLANYSSLQVHDIQVHKVHG